MKGTTVFLLEREISWEGSDVLGIYVDLEEAEAERKRLEDKEDDEFGLITYHIHEKTLI